MEAFNQLPQKSYLMPLRIDINQPYLQSLVMQSEHMIYQSIQSVLFNPLERIMREPDTYPIMKKIDY